VEKAVVRSLSTKVTDALFEVLTVEQINELRLSFHVFPEDWPDNGGPATSTLQLVLALEKRRQKTTLGIKRLLDVVGSLVAMFVCLPVFIVIAMAIKLTSKGPVFFRQVRLGQYGKKFTFLKFRSMHVNNDSSVHEKYVKQFIAGSASQHSAGGTEKIYKLAADRRVTPIGRLLRKSSLDELPQFLNVLKGDMSLVGPRPPVMYEYESYGVWHRQRLSAVKPGITGLWQVNGRSRVTFDEMVRLDIRYARSWSLWLDLKILLLTPRAVLSGIGAC
jgi:lipopolysaccharide/colanic/teichoic acid biosynthesis glycosyltransferase